MRLLMMVAATLALAACGAPESKAPDAPPAQAPAASVAAEHEALVGVWSFDRTCASGDGMHLNADGTASYDEWGGGTWSMDGENQVALDLAVSEPGVGPTGERQRVVVEVTWPVTDDLNGRILGTPPREVTARRCPE